MNPVIKIDELRSDFVKFRLRGVSLAYANALRRIMIAEVPTMAIEFVTFLENTTPLHDEFISHRLGLLPLLSHSVDSFNFPSECACNESGNVCSVCSVKFTLKVKNNNEQAMDVTSEHLIADAQNEAQRSVKPVKYKIELEGRMVERDVLLMRLGANQELSLECVAKKGIGKMHAKWSPVCVTSLRFEPMVQLNSLRAMELSEAQRKGLVASCPKKVFDYNNKSEMLEVVRPTDCIYCDECEAFANELDIEDLVKIEEGEFIFEVESTGSLKAEEIVDFSIFQLQKKINASITALRELSFPDEHIH